MLRKNKVRLGVVAAAVTTATLFGAWSATADPTPGTFAALSGDGADIFFEDAHALEVQVIHLLEAERNSRQLYPTGLDVDVACALNLLNHVHRKLGGPGDLETALRHGEEAVRIGRQLQAAGTAVDVEAYVEELARTRRKAGLPEARTPDARTPDARTPEAPVGGAVPGP